MNFHTTVLSLAVLVLVVLIHAPTPASAKFNAKRAEKAAARLRDNKFLSAKGQKGKRNRAIIEEAKTLLATTYSDCVPSVCFALDGSAQLSANQFELQKDFVELCAATLSGFSGAQFAATQYAGSSSVSYPISPLLPADDQFLADVSSTVQKGSDPTYVAPGIQYCVQEFPASYSKFQKIVVLGDVQTNRGSDNAASIANNFRAQQPGNGLCAAIVGHGSTSGYNYFLNLVGGVNALVRRPASWDDLITEIIAIFEGICEPQT